MPDGLRVQFGPFHIPIGGYCRTLLPAQLSVIFLEYRYPLLLLTILAPSLPVIAMSIEVVQRLFIVPGNPVIFPNIRHFPA